MNADLLGPEHSGEQGKDAVFGVRAGPVGGCPTPARNRQCSLVDLAVGRQRQPIEKHQRGRCHVPGERAYQVPPHRVLDDVRIGPGFGHDIPDDPVVPGLRCIHGGDGGTHPGHRGHRGRDLAEFDAVPTQLDLVVDPAAVVEGTGGVVTREIACAVHLLPARHERVGDEPARGQPATAEISR